MNKPKDLKSFPVHKSDSEAAEFVDTADLSEYDFSGFRPMTTTFDNIISLVNKL